MQVGRGDGDEVVGGRKETRRERRKWVDAGHVRDGKATAQERRKRLGTKLWFC